jgi:antitoxin VapB
MESISNLQSTYILRVITFIKSCANASDKAVRIPVEFQFDTDEVEIFRRDDELVLRKKATSLANAFHFLAALPDDMLTDRTDDAPQERLGL